MALVEQLIERIEDCQSLEELGQELEFELSEAASDPLVYQALLDLSDHLRKRGYREFQLWLLMQLYEGKQQKKVAYYLAKAYFELGDYPMALDWLALTKVAKSVFLPNYLEARIYYEMGAFAQASTILTQLIKEFPTHFEAYQLLADLTYAQGELDKARYYNQILWDYFPNKVDRTKVRQRFMALALESEFLVEQEALEWLEMPGLPLQSIEDYLLAIQLYQKMELYQQAADLIPEALLLDSEDIRLHYLALELGLALDNQDLIVSQLDWLFEVVAADDELMADLVIYARQSRYVSAKMLAKLQDAYELAEDEALAFEIVHLIVEGQLALGDSKAALHYLEQISADFPDPDYLAWDFAKVYAQLGQGDQALTYYLIAKEIEGLAPELAVELAQFYLTQQEQQAALATIEEALALEPGHEGLQSLKEVILAKEE